ncbi:MAG: patatin-like phospholipase family protein [Bacillota bacterium]
MRIGLALSGGAARGIAHIGVLKYLEEKQIKPYCLAGTSAGSIVGALYCSGKTVKELTKIASSLSWKSMLGFSFPKMGLLDSSRLLNIIEEYIGEVAFEELNLPLVINAVDLSSGKEVVLEKGSVAVAVQASCAIPGIFTPVKYNDSLLVDGGLLNNLPTPYLMDKKLDCIIAVNVGAQRALNKEPGNIFEVLIQSFDVVQQHRDQQARKYADYLLEPDLGDLGFFDTGNSDLLIERGYETARQVLQKAEFKAKPGLLGKWLGKLNNKKEVVK